MGYNTVAVLYNDHMHLIREDRDIGKRIASAMQSWHARDLYPLAPWFGCGSIISQVHADYSQVVVVGQNRGRRLCDCNDLDGYALDQLADALRRHGWTVKAPGKKRAAARGTKGHGPV